MPQSSGIAGIVQQPPEQGLDMSGLVQLMMGMKQMKQQQAKESLSTTMQLAEKGLADPSALEKAVKGFEKAYGVKIQEQLTPQQGKAVQGAGKAGELPSGAQSATPVDPSSAKAYPAGGVQPSLQGGNMYENYINEIKRRAASKNLDEQRSAELNTKVSELKTAALSGDQGAREQLQALGVVSFDKEYERIQEMKKADPKGYAAEMASAHDRAMGLEEPAAKEMRRSQFVTSLVSNGYTPEQASKEFDKPGSSGMKKSMKQLSEEADWFAKLQSSFGDEAAQKLATMMGAGASISEAIPAVGKYQSQFAQQMAETKRQHEESIAVQREQTDVDRDRAQTDKDQLSATKTYQSGMLKNAQDQLEFQKELGDDKLSVMNDKIVNELAKEANRAFSANITDMLTAVKNGVKVPKEIQDRYIEELGRRAGITKLEGRNWLNRMTFGLLGKGDVYAPDTDTGKGVLDKLVPGATPQSATDPGVPKAGAPLNTEMKTQTMNEMLGESTVGKFLQAITQAPRDPIGTGKKLLEKAIPSSKTSAAQGHPARRPLSMKYKEATILQLSPNSFQVQYKDGTGASGLSSLESAKRYVDRQK